MSDYIQSHMVVNQMFDYSHTWWWTKCLTTVTHGGEPNVWLQSHMAVNQMFHYIWKWPKKVKAAHCLIGVTVVVWDVSWRLSPGKPSVSGCGFNPGALCSPHALQWGRLTDLDVFHLGMTSCGPLLPLLMSVLLPLNTGCPYVCSPTFEHWLSLCLSYLWSLVVLMSVLPLNSACPYVCPTFEQWLSLCLSYLWTLVVPCLSYLWTVLVHHWLSLVCPTFEQCLSISQVCWWNWLVTEVKLSNSHYVCHSEHTKM